MSDPGRNQGYATGQNQGHGNPSPDYKTISSFGQEITDNLLVNHDGAEFLPADKFRDLINRSRVAKILTAAELGTEPGFIDFVVKDATCLFLTLASMSTEDAARVSWLKELKSNHLTDESLPITFQMTRDAAGSNTIWNWHPDSSTSNSGTRDPLHIMGWDRYNKDMFNLYQWRFLAPVFGTGQPFRFQFPKGTVLPYVKVDRRSESKGFFGEVSKVNIHPAHIKAPKLAMNKDGSIALALKKANDDPGLYEYFDKEANNLQKLKGYKSNHLIKPIAAYEYDGDRCLLFPWAEGGNLAEYWSRRNSGSSLNKKESAWIFSQLTGLFGALEELHQNNCRHGDLKPENILLFIDADKTKTLQIADLGLTTFHELDAATRIRKAKDILTMTPPGTSRYEPPEMDKDRDKKLPAHKTRSRAYDIWSMGCVVLELLIWLANDFEAVSEFRNNTAYFWDRVKGKGKKYCVQYDSKGYIQTLSTKWPARSAWGELLTLVKTRLLVVKVSENWDVSSPRYRGTASEAHKTMRRIQKKYYPVTTDDGLAPGYDYEDNGIIPSLPSHENNLDEFDGLVGIERKATEELEPKPRRSLAKNNYYEVNSKFEEQRSKLNDSWEFHTDNTFASQVFEKVNYGLWGPLTTGKKIFCAKCITVSSQALFPSEFKPLDAQSHCDLCGILLDALRRVYNVLPEVVRLRQTRTTISVEDGPNLLSIYIEPDRDIPPGRQIGLTTLPGMNSTEQLTLLKQWLCSCDSAHDACNRRAGQNDLGMPTRLVKVTEPMKVLSSSTLESCRYIALSHCWGQLQKHERFCLYRENHTQLQEHIEFNCLPKTFQDAITVTRGLGIDYIWIDTLCIIQDDKDDWENESTKMEEVFSEAYCTISAASAKSSLDGFLSDRPPRQSVHLQVKGSPDLYVCPHIDDFHQDVELAEINRRGWVLQERALSRRSIYFTPNQVYWECGDGIRCETLGRLYNSKAAFLGDANFPQSALDYYRDGRQLLIQDLYERYSALAFTMASDRAVAILGLQTRLARALKTQAAHGSFEKYFARSILWKRNQPADMTTIVQSTWTVPTWSWFSKSGKIQYMDLEFDKIEWANEDFESPFSRNPDLLSGASYFGRGEDHTILRGVARCMDISEEQVASQIVFDRKNELKAKDLRVVIIGRDKEGLDAKAHALVICKSQNESRGNRYERVGVASLLETQFLDEGVKVDIW
nr:heterokaryon incompatibility protein [Colletotrichum truncatum]KAF6785925.1 heterokaryon incompatibility protein [Colletotrichum truncatum]